MKKCKLCGKEFEIIDKGWTRAYCYECSPSYGNDSGNSHANNITTKRRAIKKHLIERELEANVYNVDTINVKRLYSFII